MKITSEQIESIISKYPPERHFVLAIMQDLQKAFGYIPRDGLKAIDTYLSCGVAQLYSMVTFYKALSLTPKGKHVIKICNGTACHIRRATNILDGVTRLLGIKPGETTPDGLFSLELVNCLGACAISPVIVIDEAFYGKMTVEQLPQIFDLYRKKEDER
jgi:NADH-quinone oxidoreductase subunit E